MSYTIPKTWKTEGLTPPKLNTYISDNMYYLRYRNRVSVTYSAADIAITVATLAPVNDSFFRLTLNVTENADLKLMIRVGIEKTLNLDSPIFFDIWTDDSYYLSSRTATALARGLFSKSVQSATANAVEATYFEYPLRGLSAGVHTFSLHAARPLTDAILGCTLVPLIMEIEEW